MVQVILLWLVLALTIILLRDDGPVGLHVLSVLEKFLLLR
jgi:hypothetical protein